MPFSITFVSRSNKDYDVTEAHNANKFVFLDFYVAAFCNLGFTICGSYTEQIWQPLNYAKSLKFSFCFRYLIGFRLGFRRAKNKLFKAQQK